MMIRRSLILALPSLLAIAAFACGPPTDTEVHSGVFRDDLRGLVYPVSESYQTLHRFRDEDLNGSYEELKASTDPSQFNSDAFLFTSELLEKNEPSSSAHLQALANALVQGRGVELLRPARPIRIAGKAWTRADFRAHDGHGYLYVTSMYVDWGDNRLEWTFRSPSPDRLGALVSSLKKITYLPKKPTPWKERHISGGVPGCIIPDLIRIEPPDLERRRTKQPDGRSLFAGTKGTVRLHAVIGKDGAVEELRVLSGDSSLVPRALEIAKSYTFQPYQLNNEPVSMIGNISIEFLGPEQLQR
jgi:hypothetical protein